MLSFTEAFSQLPLLSSLLHPLLDLQSSSSHQCPHPLPLSCPFPPPSSVNTCCLNHPSGHFLLAQFWDTAPALGPNNSFSLHGLWPDLCNGGFEQFCDDTRSRDDIRHVLSSLYPEVTEELLNFMDTYWLALDGRNERLWAHEWNKHGTCISTLEPACYDSGDVADGVDILDYFLQATSLFKTLDTYSLLADAGILPSQDRTYSLAELGQAIESSDHGFPVTFRCNRFGELDEVWYHFTVRGSLRGAASHSRNQPSPSPLSQYPLLNATVVRQIFIPTGPNGQSSNCPRRGIRYLPKHSPPHNSPSQPGPSPTTSVAPTTTPTTAPFTGRGHLEVHVLNDPSAPAPWHLSHSQLELASSANSNSETKKGCLIRRGEWYPSGACATYRAQPDIIDPGHSPLFSLSSSYSPCLINPETLMFECTKSSTVQGIFSADQSSPTVLAYKGRSKFYANTVPSRYEKVEIYADDGSGERQVEVEVHWVPI